MPDADGGEPGAGAISLEEALQSYRGWTTRTAQPQAISAEIFALCRVPSLPEQRFVDSKHGQVQLLLLDWLNEPAALGFQARGQPAFPVGSAIVKQKLRLTAAGEQELAALGVMIKRAPGFDAAHGDWEYGYWEPSSGLSSGQESQTYCGDCHAGSTTDHVFLDQSWRVQP